MLEVIKCLSLTKNCRKQYKTKTFLCLSFRENKKRYYENLNEKFVVDNRLFRKTVKPLLSDNVPAKDKIHLIENNESVKTDQETTEVLITLFSSIVQNLDISRYSKDKPLVSNTNDATLKAILKYRNHPSIIVVRSKCKDEGNFIFIAVHEKQVEKEILKLDVNKASRSFDVPKKI